MSKIVARGSAVALVVIATGCRPASAPMVPTWTDTTTHVGPAILHARYPNYPFLHETMRSGAADAERHLRLAGSTGTATYLCERTFGEVWRGERGPFGVVSVACVYSLPPNDTYEDGWTQDYSGDFIHEMRLSELFDETADERFAESAPWREALLERIRANLASTDRERDGATVTFSSIRSFGLGKTVLTLYLEPEVVKPDSPRHVRIPWVELRRWLGFRGAAFGR